MMPRLRWTHRRLALKVTVPMVLLVLGMTVVSAIVIGRLVTQIHRREAGRQVARFSAIVEDAYGRNLDAQHAALGPFLALMCRSTESSAFVMNRDGRVVLACEQGLVGSLQPGSPVGQRVSHGGDSWTRWTRPIRGGPTCTSCHAGADPIGSLAVDVPAAETDAEVHQQRRVNLWAGGILVAAIALLLVVVQVVFVYWPVKRLTATVERMRGGDLSVRIRASRSDEIGQLGMALNEMAASIQAAEVELGRTHRAELAQSEKLAALGQLFSSVAHEIKNQLAGIIGALKVVEGEVPDSDPNKPVMGKILSQMEQMSRTAVTALEFARPLKPAVTSVDLTAVLDRTLFFIERQASEQGVTLRKRYAVLPPARIDEELMKQVFLNLLLNGVQAMPKGGTLEVETRAAGPHAVEVVISDQGVGIAPENLARIFSPFFSTKTQGTGLGLYIARQIVETQRGEIHVASTPGRGSSFTIRLPAEAHVES